MQVSVETTSTLERRVTIEVPAERVDEEVSKRLQDTARKVRLNGFRVGKVPMKVVKQRFGDSIRAEVLGEVINSTYFEALEQEDLKPAGMPSIDTTKNEEGQALEYVATLEVYPDVELCDYSKFTITKLTATIADADIDKMIDNLREQRAEWNTVERAAKDGDKAIIDFTGTKDGEEFPGGKGENHNLVLGSGSMIPGFEAGIEGLKAGEEKTLALTFPEDYHVDDLKGAAVEFAVKVNEVQEKALPEVDEKFMEAFGVTEGGLEKLREDIKANMERELKAAQKQRVKNQVMDALFENQTIEIPKALVANEIDALRKQMVQQFGGAAQSMDLNSILPDSMFEEQANKRVALGLTVNELIKVENLQVDAEKVQEMIREQAATYGDPEAVIQYYNSNQEARAQVEGVVLEDQVIDHIAAAATVTEENSDYETIVKQDSQQ